MLQDSLWSEAQRQLEAYGRDENGNYVLSPSSVQEVLKSLIELANLIIERPVITTTYRDVVDLCHASGLRVERVIEDNVAVEKIYDKTGSVEIYEEAQNLINSTVYMVLQKVQKLSQTTKE